LATHLKLFALLATQHRIQRPQGLNPEPSVATADAIKNCSWLTKTYNEKKPRHAIAHEKREDA